MFWSNFRHYKVIWVTLCIYCTCTHVRLIISSCHRSHCLLKLNRPKKACVTLQNALDLDRHNVKALYRMGKAKYLIGNDSAWEDARRYLMRAQVGFLHVKLML